MTQPRPQTVGWLLLPLLATVDGVGAVAAHAARDAGADAASTGLDVAAVETAALFPREYYLAPGLPAQKLQARQAGCQPGTHPCRYFLLSLRSDMRDEASLDLWLESGWDYELRIHECE
jgi:hypothetical protein